jgi:hypothetical protein
VVIAEEFIPSQLCALNWVLNSIKPDDFSRFLVNGGGRLTRNWRNKSHRPYLTIINIINYVL